MLSHLKHNYLFYLLFLGFILLARFDITWQNSFLTEYYRLPFYTLTVITCIFIFLFCYKNAKLCNTQSLNYKKLALTTIGYSGYEIFSYFMTRDPSKAQLLIYTILFLLALIFYFHKDTRLNTDTESEEYKIAFKHESKYVQFLIYPAILVIFLLQNIFYLYVDFSFELYFNPFLQIALGIAIANFCLIFTKTRLDNLKHFLLIIETIFLIFALCFYLYLFIAKFNFLNQSFIRSTEVINYVCVIISISFINLLIAFSKSWKSFVGYTLKLASIILYLSLFLVSYRIIYY